MTYAEIDVTARTVAARLQQIAPPGERALLLYPPGLDYITAFFGCLYAGIIAVPVYPPNPARLERTLPRLQAITADAQPTIVLTTASIAMFASALADQACEFQSLHWIATDSPTNLTSRDHCIPDITEDTIAFLQYTSGSTGTPKGVVLSHANLLHNSLCIHQGFVHSTDSRGVIWLPPYHDMGLIGGIIQPLYGGFPVTLMSPVTFLQQPLRWLETISRTQATTSGGPNFAYDLCVRKVTTEQLDTLDLSHWQVAFNGAEPIRTQTLERFATTFAACGFRREAFYPCYGLAEATLIVSGGITTAPPVTQSVQKSALAHNRAVIVLPEDDHALTLVSSGTEVSDHDIVIVNPTTHERCISGEVGEIWVKGPSIAQGYWQKPVETQQTFQATLAKSHEGPFLRTGDLGFMHDDELFVTGRLKDLIIIRGRNYYPQDIEYTTERSHPALRVGCSAAFTVEVDEEVRLVVVQEIDRHHRHVETDEITNAIRQAIAEQHDVATHAVVLLKTATIPKTSSGKIQRHACQARYLENTLDVHGMSILEEASADDYVVSEHNISRDTLLTLSPSERTTALTAYLRHLAAQTLRHPLAAIDPQQPLTAFGLDSLASVELQHQIEAHTGTVIPMTTLLQGPSIVSVANTIADQLLQAPEEHAPQLIPALDTRYESPLSYGQRALWFIHQLAPESAAYNIATAIRIHAQIHIPILQQTLQQLIERHPSLRTTFTVRHGEPVQQVHDQSAVFLSITDTSTWDATALQTHLEQAAHAPFDLEQGPLLRVLLCTRSSDEHILLLVVHHLVADFWSLAVLAHDLHEIYDAEIAGKQGALSPQHLHYSDFVDWQDRLLEGTEGARLWQYWQQQLAGELPLVTFPTDHPRPAIQTYRGAKQSFLLDHNITQHINALSERSDVTVYTILLTAFSILLHRYTGQNDLVIGTPVTGRNRAQLADIVGYFVNPVVIRTLFADNPTLASLLSQTRQTLLDAFSHQDYPFALLAERLHAQRDPSYSPLFQLMFVYQKAPVFAGQDISGLALDNTGVQIHLGDWPVEPAPLQQHTSQFDLTMTITEANDQLAGALHFNTDLFDQSTMSRLIDHFRVLLEALVAHPNQVVTALPLLTDVESQQILVDWNATQTSYPHQACIHDLFEEQAQRTPKAPAVIFEDQQLTYRELDQRANQLARYLRTRGVGPHTQVGVCVERSFDLMVALLGILKTGAAYVPLDPSYPQERLMFMLEDAQVIALVTQQNLVHSLALDVAQVIQIDVDWPAIAEELHESLPRNITSEALAYMIYTSGSTGTPKGVMISHRNVVNFFSGMDERIGCTANDTLLAVTSISFDISVLELFWTLTRGAKVVLFPERIADVSSHATSRSQSQKPIDFSLFYFASEDTATGADAYRLLLEGAQFADTHGFEAVWTPERHFHAFGGLYPNAAVTSAGLATITNRINIRAGSVVVPLHHPIRIAEEWSLVDNLSQGRVGIACASGWHANDFVFFPENYANRKDAMIEGIEMIQKLWRGEHITSIGGAGNEVEVRLFPRPVQSALPIWFTAAGNPETFVKAGEIGANVLTHLLGQSLEDVAERIQLYRASLAEHGHDPQAGRVTLMLHTFIDDDLEIVQEKVRIPFTNYLRSSINLIHHLIQSFNLSFDLNNMSDQDMDALLQFAFDRYFETSALFGTPATGLTMIDRLKEMGVDEVACLIDFGVDVDSVLNSLPRLNELRVHANQQNVTEDYSIATQAIKHNATMMQCTPSMMRMLSLNQGTMDALQSLRVLMLGGEALPPALANHIKQTLPCGLVNMYGPTETTIWSATYEIETNETAVPIGTPIANTQIYIFDEHRAPVPIGVVGELYIGGDGVAQGYFNRPSLTDERFVPNPFDPTAASRLYKTGDLARYRQDGVIEFLGRVDYQVKLRGFRIELGEIEAVLSTHPEVRESVVIAHTKSADDVRLVAYIVVYQQTDALSDRLQTHLRERLPEYMVPSVMIQLDTLPLTANGKVDRKALPAPEDQHLSRKTAYIEPRNNIEQTIADIWQNSLHVTQVGINDNFFDLGGHSLLMAQVQSQLQDTLSCEIPLVKMLEYPTISALARYLNEEEHAAPRLQQSVDRAQRQRAVMRRQRQGAQKTRSHVS